MKLTACAALLATLFGIMACKGKEQPPTPAASAGALSSSAALPLQVPSASGATSALDGFEGEIGLTAKGKLTGKEAAASPPTNLSLLVKDGKFRFDIPEGLSGTHDFGKIYVLVTPADKRLYAVMDDKKQAVLLEFDKLSQQAKMLSAGRPQAKQAPPAQLEKTGKTDVVAGYPCDIWQLVSEKSLEDLCIAEQGTSWLHIPLSGVPPEYAWASQITDGKHIPLRFVSSENGVERARLEVTSIQKKALAADQFQVPAGYAILNLQQMLGAMLAGMPAGMPGMPPGARLPAGLPSGFVPPHATAPHVQKK